MTEKTEKCNIRLVPKGKEDWAMELSGDCTETERLIANLPPRKNRYIVRRTRKID